MNSLDPDKPSPMGARDDEVSGWPDPNRGERKFVTVLFIDLAHSSDIVAGADPEDSNDILLPIVQEFGNAVRTMGGTVTQMLGDGIMAVFGAPTAMENHARNACRAAERIRSAAVSGTIFGSGRLRFPFEVRLGISSGEVVAQPLHDDRWPSYRMAGEAVHLASRMERLARPNGIWITEDTLALLDGNADVRRLGRFSLAPGARDKAVFELVGLTVNRKAPRFDRSRHRTRMFGRSDEFGTIARTLFGADAGPGAKIVVAGEAGIGKSRLVEELVAEIGARSLRVVAIGSAPPGFSSPSEDLAVLATEVLGLRSDFSSPDFTSAISGALERVGLGGDDRIDDLLGVFGKAGQLSVRCPPDEQFEHSVSLLGDAVAAMSRERPVVVVVEDIHWASSALRRFAAEASRRGDSLPISLVATSRTPVDPFIAELAGSSVVELQPLSDAESHALLKDFAGRSHDLPAVVDFIIRKAQGNPLFLVEYAYALVQEGFLDGSPGNYFLRRPLSDISLPATIQDILAARLDGLPTQERATLLAGSVIGHSFDVDLLKTLMVLPGNEISVTLDSLTDKGFVTPTRTLPNIEFSFRHALIHEVAYTTLLRKSRRQMHGRLLAEIKKRPSSMISGKTELMADHAYRAEHRAEAYLWNLRAGLKAQEKSWNQEAERYLRHAKESLEFLANTPRREARWTELVACYVRSLFALGRYDDARELLEDAAAAPTVADVRKQKCEIASLTVLYHWTRSSLRETEAAAERALEMAEAEGDMRLRIPCAVRLGVIRVDKGDFVRGHDLLTWTASHISGRRHLDTFGLMAIASVACRVASARALAEMGAFDDAKALCYQAIEAADEAKHVFSQIHANLAAALVLIRARHVEQSLPFLERARVLSELSRFWLVQPLISTFAGVAHVMNGSIADGLRLLEDSSGETDVPPLMVRRSAQRAWQAEGFLLAGVAEKAVALGWEALAGAREKCETPIEAMSLRVVGEARTRLAGETDPESEALIEQALALGHSLGMRPHVAQCELALARIDQLRGDRDAAAGRLDRADAVFRQCRMRPPTPAEGSTTDRSLVT